MPEHLRALVVILLLAIGVFALAKGPAVAAGTAPGDFNLRRNTWLAITLAAFLAHSFWLFIAVAGAILLFAAARERNPVALYFAALFAVPAISVDIPGVAGIRFLFAIDYIRLLALAALLPAFLTLLARDDAEPFGRRWPDRLIVLYIALNFALAFASSSATHALRQGLFYPFIDVFLPYYVASRSVRSVAAFKDAMMAFVVAALVLAAIGIFESARHWLLYRSLEDALGAYWGFGNYLQREGHLRALGSAGQPIAFGYVMAVAIGFLLYLRRSVQNPLAVGAAFSVLAAALLASVSRGPWLGAAVIVLLGLAPGRSPGLRALAVGGVAIVAMPLLFMTSLGEAILDLLPFVGTVDADTVLYRRQLLDAFIDVISKNLLFGAYDYMLSPEVEGLRQGEGIIDIVNTYVGVGFTSGLVGLSLFAGFFCSAMVGALRAARLAGEADREVLALGQILVASLLSIVVMISAVASITVIAPVYWAVAGLAVAYVRMVAAAHAPSVERIPCAQPQPS